MKLAGRLAAAIEVLADLEARHRPVADALKDWGLSHRFAGSGDRAAIGNFVYDALRRRSSLAWRMGGDTPWHLALGVAIFEWGETPAALNAAFADDRHAPPPIPEDFCAPRDIRRCAGSCARRRSRNGSRRISRRRSATSWVAEGEALAGAPAARPSRQHAEGRAREGGAAARAPRRDADAHIRRSVCAFRRSRARAGIRTCRRRRPSSAGASRCRTRAASFARFSSARSPANRCSTFAPAPAARRWRSPRAMENRGQIYATDSDKSRLAPIFERLKRAGARNVQVRPPEPGGLDDLAGADGPRARRCAMHRHGQSGGGGRMRSGG